MYVGAWYRFLSEKDSSNPINKKGWIIQIISVKLIQPGFKLAYSKPRMMASESQLASTCQVPVWEPKVTSEERELGRAGRWSRQTVWNWAWDSTTCQSPEWSQTVKAESQSIGWRKQWFVSPLIQRRVLVSTWEGLAWLGLDNTSIKAEGHTKVCFTFMPLSCLMLKH